MISSDSIIFNRFSELVPNKFNEPISIRGTGRTSSMVLDAINSVYKGFNTDVYFLTFDQARHNVQLVQEIFKTLNCSIIKIKNINTNIVIDIQVLNKIVRLILRSKESFDVMIYKGVHNRVIFIDHTLQFV